MSTDICSYLARRGFRSFRMHRDIMGPGGSELADPRRKNSVAPLMPLMSWVMLISNTIPSYSSFFAGCRVGLLP